MSPTPTEALVIFHIQDQNGKPVSGALLSATSPTVGPWQGLTDCAGNFNATLMPAHYDIAITAQGCAPDTLPADISSCGVITHGITRSFSPAPRTYRGQMCGSRVPGLPAVPGGYDPSLVLSWFIDRYQPSDRHRIYDQWHADGVLDVLTSWPDSRSFGQTPQQFGATQEELIGNNFTPAPFLASKDYDPTDAPGIIANVNPVLPFIIGVVPRISVFWEGNLWLSPTVVQTLIDEFAPQFLAYGCKVYVHFGPGEFGWQQPGQPTSAFWNGNVGKLTGILHQRNPSEDNGDMSVYQSRITDCLQRFSGQDGFVTDSGFGHPFDFIALEITADEQANEGMTEATGNAWGQAALATPACATPDGTPVACMGSGNGQ